MRAGPTAPCKEATTRGRPVAVTPHAEEMAHHGKAPGDNGGVVATPPPYPVGLVRFGHRNAR